MRLIGGVLAIIWILSPAGTAWAQPSQVAATARSLAENVLGSGTVTSLTLTDGGATILIRWVAATFRPNLKVEAIRDGLVAEAQLATGSILGRLFSVSRVKFSIRRAQDTLATGENNRSGGLRLTFAASLGGGTYVPAPAASPTTTKKSSGGTSSAKD